MRSLDQKTMELVTLAKRGDKPALSRLYRIYSERIKWIVRFRMGTELRSQLESMDIVQETLLNVFSGLEGFTYKNEGDFVRWLSKIAENQIKGTLRKLHADKRDIRKEVHVENFSDSTNSKAVLKISPLVTTTPSVIMSRKEDLAKLEKAIDQLKPQHREVVILAKFDGLSYTEIAARLNRSAEAVRKLVSRAIAELTVAFRGI